VDAGIVAIDVAAAFGKPDFFTAHSLGAWKREQMEEDPEEMEKKYKFKHRISEEVRIFKSVRAQTVTTKVQKEKLEQLYGLDLNNVAVISPGVDIHTFRRPEPGEKETRTELPPRYIFCLSRIDSNKGHDLLLDAFDIVRREVPDIDLVIGGGSLKPRQRELEILSTMKKIIEEKSMGERVNVVGYVPDESLVPYYQQAELFVLPSVFEPFGMTALEAMACDTPVVASRYGGIKNVISSGENGLLVDPHNAREFADAMIALLKDRRLAESMAHKGRETIHNHFSWEVIAEKHIKFYSKFMKE
jgi:mannosylfructose-phosphate synthase